MSMTDRELAVRTYRLVRELMYQRALELAKQAHNPESKTSVWQEADDAVQWVEDCDRGDDEPEVRP